MANRHPWMKFFCADWLKDPNLGRCSREARGFWIDALCLLHEAEEVGVFITNGVAWTDQEIAGAVRGDYEGNLRCLTEVVAKGVAARTRGGALFSRRMVRDEEKRKKCSEAGRSGGNPVLKAATLKGVVKPEVKPPLKPEVKQHSDSDFFQKSVEREFSLVPNSVEEKKELRSALDIRIDDVSREMTLRHPKRRSCGPKEAQRLLRSILNRNPAREREELLERINFNHLGWCRSREWSKDGGEFAKGLANWLAPTHERYLEQPSSALEDLPPQEEQLPPGTCTMCRAAEGHHAAWCAMAFLTAEEAEV